MNAVAAILVLMSNQGHWFGGQAGEVSVRWATQGEHPAAVLAWDLMLGPTRVAGNRLAMAATTQPSKVVITLPEVRARVSMRWVYRVTERDGGTELARGEELIHVYPNDLLAPLGKLLAAKRIIAWDRSGDLSKVLDRVNVRHRRCEHSGDLQLATADIILVGPDCVGASPLAQSPLINQAQAGAGVVTFMQTQPRMLAGYPLMRRPVPTKLQWRTDHPLLEQFRPEDLESWLGSPTAELWAIQLPADEAAVEVAYWPREVPGQEPVPIDALLVTKAVGKGRIVFCQIPLGGWQDDPRSQLLLSNVLSYLATRPEPTPPPSRRRIAPAPSPTSVPTITIPPGGRP